MESTNKFNVYRSSAGSGKTYTIVKEYLKLCLATEKFDAYKQILAITFTNKAANEMKERVISTLVALSEEGEIKGTSSYLLNDLIVELKLEEKIIKKRAKAVLKSILHNYSQFGISTIDKFVHRIIRAFAFDLKLPFNFDVELDSDSLLNQAVDNLISNAENNSSLADVLIEFALDKTEGEKSFRIENDLKKFAASLLNDDGYNYAEKLKNISTEDFLSLQKKLTALKKDYSQILSEKGKEGVNIISKNNLTEKDFYQGKRGIYGFYSKLQSDPLNTFPTNSYVEKTITEDKWSSKESPSVDAIKSKLYSIYVEAKEMHEREGEKIALYDVVLKNIYGLTLLNKVNEEIQAIKSEKNFIHISEFNKRISEIVMNEHAPFIYERIGEQYNHFFIDEFQDTSTLQWINLLPLLDNSLAKGNFNMIVGDAKQAIYRWRGGEMELFSQLPKIPITNKNQVLLERENALVRNYFDYGASRPLNNFRSKKEIVEFNNSLFGKIIESLQKDKANEVYLNSAQIPKADNDGGGVVVRLNPDEKPQKEWMFLETKNAVDDLLKEGYNLSDIAVLCRNNKYASETANYLIENGIKVVSSESLLLHSSPKVNLVIDILKTVLQPYSLENKIRVAIGLHKTDLIKESLEGLLFQVKSKPNFLIKEILSDRFGINISNLLSYSIYEMCEWIIGTLNLSGNNDPFVTFLKENVFQYSSQNGNSLYDFCVWWDATGKYKSIVVSESLDAVKILTIHKSKGLEFPVVLLPFSDWDISRKTKSRTWIENTDEELNPLSNIYVEIQDSLGKTEHASIVSEEKEKTTIDNINLFYVACTRAVERLHIFTSKPSNKKLSGLFLDILKQDTANWDEAKNEYRIGKFQPSTKKKEKKNSDRTLDFKRRKNWREKIEINITKSFENKEEFSEKSSFGNNLHELLKEIKAETDIDEKLELACNRGLFQQEIKTELKSSILQMIHHPDVKPFFFGEGKIKTEQDIIMPQGKTLRPDRASITGEKAILLDYKTGNKSSKHVVQMKEYLQTFNEIGLKAEYGMVYYFMDNTTEKIVL